jgi:hypothetical protein
LSRRRSGERDGQRADRQSPWLDASGAASSGFTGVSSSYSANLSDTAQFLGAAFYADAAEMIPLPDIQLGSALSWMAPHSSTVRKTL